MKYTGIVFLMVLLMVNITLFSQKEKKITFEFSVGASRVNPNSIYQRSSGIDELIRQYAQYYQADYSFTGGFSESKLLIPFSFSANYRLNKKLYIKAGVDYSFSSSSASEKSFQVTWSDFSEQYDYELTNKVSYLMPHIGIGYGQGSLDFYGAVGIGLARFTHTEDLSYSESVPGPGPGYSYDTTDTFKVKGSAPGVIIGIKYRLPFFKKSGGKGINPFIKVEAVLFKVSNFNGTKTTVARDSQLENFTQTQEGTLYEYEWNPFESQIFEFWDLYASLPDGATMRNFQEMGINLSGIRIMIGISF